MGSLKDADRVSRSTAVRGVTTPAPIGWSTPDAAERLASWARSSGWSVESAWYQDEKGYRGTAFFLRVGRMLFDGENLKAKGDRWIYHLVWVEVPQEDRDATHNSRMRVEVSRCFTPTTGVWGNGPSVRQIADLIARQPVPQRFRSKL